MDTYRHLFNDTNFNRSQVELFDTTFGSVRISLGNSPKEKEKGLPESLKTLVIV